MNESCHIWMSRTEWRRVIGCLIFISHFPQKSPIISCSFAKIDLQLKASYGFVPPCIMHEWVTSCMNESYRIWMSHVVYEWVMSHMNESCHIWTYHFTYEWVMSREWVIHRVMSRIRMSHVTYEWVMSHMNESCHIWVHHVTYEWVISYMNQSSHI